MPKPSPNSYPNHKKWRFIQRSISEDILFEFSKRISECDGKKIDDCLPDLLGFLDPLPLDLKDTWLSLWVNIMHQMGLGYTCNKGKHLSVTDLGISVAETKNSREYYYYWALNFQYPFSVPKHKHYIENDVAVKPIVLILQYLAVLFKRKQSEAYLTKNEIVNYLMPSKNHDSIEDNCSLILANRKKT